MEISAYNGGKEKPLLYSFPHLAKKMGKVHNNMSQIGWGGTLYSKRREIVDWRGETAVFFKVRFY